jgi:hypothetical protein
MCCAPVYGFSLGSGLAPIFQVGGDAIVTNRAAIPFSAVN